MRNTSPYRVSVSVYLVELRWRGVSPSRPTPIAGDPVPKVLGLKTRFQTPCFRFTVRSAGFQPAEPVVSINSSLYDKERSDLLYSARIKG